MQENRLLFCILACLVINVVGTSRQPYGNGAPASRPSARHATRRLLQFECVARIPECLGDSCETIWRMTAAGNMLVSVCRACMNSSYTPSVDGRNCGKDQKREQDSLSSGQHLKKQLPAGDMQPWRVAVPRSHPWRSIHSISV